MENKNIVVVMGLSRSGKDSFYQCLESTTIHHLVDNIKWSYPMKRLFEQHYGLKPFSLETSEQRMKEVPLAGGTYLDLMVRSAEHIPKIDPYFCVRKVLPVIKECCDNGRIPVITDTRNMVELEQLLKLKDEGYYLHLVVIERGIYQGLPSDKYVHFIAEMLARTAHTYTRVDNTGTQKDLQRKAHTFASKLEPYLLEV